MDWKSVGKVIAPLAPVAGSILGGFIPIPGGSLIGQKLGELIAGAFGVPPTPQAVSDAVVSAGEETARAKINAAMEQARAEIAGFVEVEKSANELLTKSLTETNVTMRAELEHEHWFFTGWRPFIGWVIGFVYGAFGLMLVIVTGRNAWISPDPMKTLADAWPLFASYFGPGGLILGVLIHSRSGEKKEAIANGVPMPNAKPVAPAAPPVAPAKPPVITKPAMPSAVTKARTAREDSQ